MANEVRIEARPWEPQDLIDGLQLMIDEEPDSYLNGKRTTLCMARDYLKKFFAEESLRPKGQWVLDHTYQGKHKECYVCSVCNHWQKWSRQHENAEKMKYMRYCPFCGAKMEG